jgi:predicted HicB family RNase H-like nuclease
LSIVEFKKSVTAAYHFFPDILPKKETTHDNEEINKMYDTKNMDTKIPRSYRLDTELDNQLRKMAAEQKKSRSDIVRNALNDYLKKSQK